MKRLILPAIMFAAPLLWADESKPVTNLQTILEETLEEAGFSLETTHVAIVNEGTKYSVNVDVSQSVSKYLMDQMQAKLALADPKLRSVPIEIAVAGKSTMEAEKPAPALREQAPRDGLDKLKAMPAVTSVTPDTAHPLMGAGAPPANLTSVEEPTSMPDLLTDQTYAAPTPKKDDKVTAHSIILAHLEDIKASGTMYSDVATPEYWIRIFEKANHPEMYDAARPQIERAVNAGLAPYDEGETLTAEQFANLAAKALPKPETRTAPLASAPEDVIFKP